MSRITAFAAAFGVLAQSLTASHLANEASVSETVLPQTCYVSIFSPQQTVEMRRVLLS